MSCCTNTDNLAILQNLIQSCDEGEILRFSTVLRISLEYALCPACARGLDSWPLTSVEHLHLDVSLVNGLSISLKSIDFTTIPSAEPPLEGYKA